MNAGVWFFLLMIAGAIIVYFGWKKYQSDNSATITIDDAPEEGVPPHPSYNREEIKPVAVPDDAAPVEQPNPSVDRKEAEQEVLQEIVEDDKPLAETTLLEAPMVEPLDNPPTSPETADLDPVGSDVVVEPKSTRFVGKLTDDEIRTIRASEKTQAELALQYDVSTTTIRRIKKRESYAHVV